MSGKFSILTCYLWTMTFSVILLTVSLIRGCAMGLFNPF